jgi:hypothetical protein
MEFWKRLLTELSELSFFPESPTATGEAARQEFCAVHRRIHEILRIRAMMRHLATVDQYRIS